MRRQCVSGVHENERLVIDWIGLRTLLKSVPLEGCKNPIPTELSLPGRDGTFGNYGGFTATSTFESTAMKILLATAVIMMTAITAIAAEDAKKHSTDFATKAAISNMFEIEAAKIEVAKGKAADAKQFASDMLKDHGKAGPELAKAAKEDGVAIPMQLDAEHQQKLDALSKSDPANFDQAYLSTQLTAHQDAVTLFQDFSRKGPNGQLKNTAAKILPDLRMHLTRVKGLTSK